MLKMPRKTIGRALLVALLGLLPATPGAAAPAACAWPIETTGEGASNVAYPDTDATYWSMPVDSVAWPQMRIAGQFPEARFMSFTAYDADGADAVALIDEDIVPSAGSSNPFTPAGAGSSGGMYTVTVLGPGGTAAPNTLLLPTAVGWVLLRIYVADEGLDRSGGVALPEITLVAADGSERVLPVCPRGTAGGQ